jgi:hypothetical protein
MRRRKLLIASLFLAAGAGAAVLGLHVRSPGAVEVTRDQSLDADRRLITFRAEIQCPSYALLLLERYQARLEGRWIEPQKLWEEVCVVPTGADACRLLGREQPWSSSEKARLLFERCGLAKLVPTLCGWVVCHLPDKRPPLRDITLTIRLPRRAHNFSLHWTGSSRFSLVSMATPLAAAPGQ